MRPSLTSDKPGLLGAAAAIVLLVAGGAYVLLTRDDPAAEAVADHEAGGGRHADEVQEGVVVLTAAQIQAAGITLATVGPGGGGETRLAGRVEAMVDAKAAVAAAVGGTVERVLVAPGQPVRAGQALVSLVSGDAAAFRAESDAAGAAATAARLAYDRTRSLADQGVVARQEAEADRARALSAEASARAARARAAAAGSPNASGRLSVTSPISGVVTQVLVGPGGFVPQGGAVAEVSNPDRVELVFSAPPQLAGHVRVGSALRSTGPAGEFDTVVTGVAADAGAGGSGAATIRARASSGTLPPAGSAVTGAVVSGATEGALTVPSEAVQAVEGRNVVFVQVDQGFRVAPVLVGRQAAGRTEILQGLGGGERIAAANAFLLKAELAKGEAEHGH